MGAKNKIRKYTIGTIWDIKKPRINSPYKELIYAKRDKDKKRIKYWTALINIRKIMRRFLDLEWNKKYLKVKTEDDFKKLIAEVAEKRIEKYFKKDIHSLCCGDFGNSLIKKYSK